ncbi:MAG: PhzF family phenazine biosynthesis protein [Gammaproteobacteria bacterium]|nr:PhzF family phenazine biosynthesis protein [Gammaproteobacteria bacterium]
MSEIRCLQIDAFTDRPFAGNPAAVCLLEGERDAQWMQSVAEEMNLSETAFVRPLQSGFGLRWFTPRVEVDLCGHATLAAAHALWSEGIVDGMDHITFYTASGVLSCVQNAPFIELDFPATPAEPASPDEALDEILGVQPTFFGRSRFDALVVVDSEKTVRALRPDFAQLGQLPFRGVIVTSKPDDPTFDFVSRFFAPAAGVDEDPVTGSAHCCLGPYWSERLGKNKFTACQASSRGGVLTVEIAGDRVLLGGQAVTVFKGTLYD